VVTTAARISAGDYDSWYEQWAGADTERRLTADTDPELDAMAQQIMQTNPLVRWACRQGMWSFGVGTPRALLATSLAYNLRGGSPRRSPARCSSAAASPTCSSAASPKNSWNT
jgi:hypothetical protein